MALIVDALNDCKSHGMGLGVIASITEMVPSPGGEDTYVEASTMPRSHPLKFIAVVWMCAMNVWSEEETHQRERRYGRSRTSFSGNNHRGKPFADERGD
jgi:hypothetical protein